MGFFRFSRENNSEVLRFGGVCQVQLAANSRETEDARAEVEALENTVAEQKGLITRLEEDIVKVQLGTPRGWGKSGGGTRRMGGMGGPVGTG